MYQSRRNAMQRLGIVVASTRPGRRGRGIADAVHARAVEHGAFDVEILDLGEIDLPFLDEPHEATEGIYVHEHTREWSRRVEALDAFVFVMPEYNHGYNAPLKNALDFLYREWNHKPVGFVSYGGGAGGARAVQMIKQVVVALEMVPIAPYVLMPRVPGLVDDHGRLLDPDAISEATDAVLDELARLSTVLAPLRNGEPVH
jgi:NAD(P)H-dependent FMN reductase